ncbi:aldo/keto reductase [Streptomyces griseocarneus]|nr:aldo/keto reductase [Streptomyces griseocarneus]
MAERRPYPSDLPEACWELIEPASSAWRAERRRHTPDIGPAPEHDLREILNAILYVNQMEYSLATPDVVEREMLATCRELGTAAVAHSPLGRGMLAGAASSLDQLSEGDNRLRWPRFSVENIDRNLALVRAFEAVVGEIGCTPAQAALSWLLAPGRRHHPGPRRQAPRPPGGERRGRGPSHDAGAAGADRRRRPRRGDDRPALPGAGAEPAGAPGRPGHLSVRTPRSTRRPPPRRRTRRSGRGRRTGRGR